MDPVPLTAIKTDHGETDIEAALIERHGDQVVLTLVDSDTTIQLDHNELRAALEAA